MPHQTTPEILYLRQTLEIMALHIGVAGLDDVVRRHGLECRDPSPEQRVAQCSGPLDPADETFTFLWRELARLKPELFGEKLAGLSESPRGPSLAYLYELTQRPELFQRLEESPVAQLASEVAIGCTLSLPGLAPFAGIGFCCQGWSISDGSVLHSLMQSRAWGGLSLFCEPALRDVIVVPEDLALTRTNPDFHDPLLRCLIHEHIHAVMTWLALGERSLP